MSYEVAPGRVEWRVIYRNREDWLKPWQYIALSFAVGLLLLFIIVTIAWKLYRKEIYDYLRAIIDKAGQETSTTLSTSVASPTEFGDKLKVQLSSTCSITEMSPTTHSDDNKCTPAEKHGKEETEETVKHLSVSISDVSQGSQRKQKLHSLISVEVAKEEGGGEKEEEQVAAEEEEQD